MNSNFEPFKILEHSGDLRIKAYGRDEMEALAHASIALLSQIVDLDTVDQQEYRKIVVAEQDQSARIIAFLNELIYLVDARKWLPVSIKRLTTCARSGCDSLEALLAGSPYDPSSHTIQLNVKAVTYHDFSLRREGEMMTIEYVCDL